MSSDDEKRDRERDEALSRAAAELPREILPERDLWPRIAQRIATPRPSGGSAGWPRWSPLAQIAAAVALVAVSSLITLVAVRLTETVPTGVGPGAQVPIEFASYPDYPFGPRHRLGPQYTEIRADLLMNVEARLALLDPETRATVEENLAEIRRSLVEINQALTGDPNNILLQQLLLNAYQEELHVMTNVNRITESIPARTDI